MAKRKLRVKGINLPEEARAPIPPDRIVLPFVRAWDIKTAQLFVECFQDVAYCQGVEFHVRAHEGAVYYNRPTKAPVSNWIYFRSGWSSRKLWTQLLTHLSALLGNGSDTYNDRFITWWEQFWAGDMPIGDLQLYARYAVFMEKKRRRKKCETNPT